MQMFHGLGKSPCCQYACHQVVNPRSSCVLSPFLPHIVFVSPFLLSPRIYPFVGLPILHPGTAAAEPAVPVTFPAAAAPLDVHLGFWLVGLGFFEGGWWGGCVGHLFGEVVSDLGLGEEGERREDVPVRIGCRIAGGALGRLGSWGGISEWGRGRGGLRTFVGRTWWVLEGLVIVGTVRIVEPGLVDWSN